MQGTPPEGLNAGNCANPRFSGSLGAGASSPGDPLSAVQSLAGGGTGVAAQQAAGPAAAAASSGAASGKAGSSTKSAGGGSTSYRALHPVAYTRPSPHAVPGLPVLAFLALIALPPAAVSVVLARRARRNRVAPDVPSPE
jgi:phosphate transport system substrate-binding protein